MTTPAPIHHQSKPTKARRLEVAAAYETNISPVGSTIVATAGWMYRSAVRTYIHSASHVLTVRTYVRLWRKPGVNSKLLYSTEVRMYIVMLAFS